MIYAYTGKTGSGKTFTMVKTAYKYWRSGVDIYSNTILNFCDDINYSGYSILENPKAFSKFERFKQLFRKKSKPYRRGRITYFEDISEILEAKNGLILFDEAQVLFNARNWEKLSDEFQYKLQQHRKHRLDLFCTTQNIRTIDVNYRRLVQRWFHHKPLMTIRSNPVIWGVFKRDEKDIDELWESVDELKVTTIKRKLFFIHRFSKVLYDTFYDIGFKRFKTIWLSNWISETRKMKSEWIIMPKEMSLSEGQKAIRLSELGLQPSKSKSFKKG